MSKLILSLDGGGIRGAATTQFLYRVEKVLNKKYACSIRDCVDFYAGTSTGSIITLALATTNMGIDEINSLYNHENGKRIFAENRGLLEVDGLNAPKYEAEGKSSMLKSNFGDTTLGDVKKGKHLLAITYSITERKPTVIKSTNPDHLNFKSCEVADASSAAPIFFPTKEMEINSSNQWLIDGGVIANNPTMCAVAETRKCWKTPVSEIKVLSIGTGFRSKSIDGSSSKDWGALGWIIKGKLVDILFDEGVVDYQAKTLLEENNYLRVNSQIMKQDGLPNPPVDAMDDISEENINRLKSMGDFWFEQYGERAVRLLVGESVE